MMIHYINKADIIAEIKRIIDTENENINSFEQHKNTIEKQRYNARMALLEHILSFLDTLEVKEVDFEEELISLIEKEKAFVTDNREVKYYNGDSFNHIYELEFIAKHFFELGLKVQKGGEK